MQIFYMKLKCKWFEKKVDERQEMDLLKVEHMGFWLMYYMLLAAIFIQIFLFDDGFEMAAGEWIIFMSISIICLIGWIRKGVWSYQTRKVPGVRSYLKYSIISAIGLGIVFGVAFSFKWNDTSPSGIIMRIISTMITMFIIIFPTFLVAGTIARRREKKLSDKDFEEDEEEN